MALIFDLTTFSGVAISARVPIRVRTANFGGDDPSGILTSADVVLEVDASGYSPLLLQAFAEQTSHKVIIKGYRSDPAGRLTLFIKITLTSAKVDSYHAGGTTQGRFTDTLRLTFLTLDFDFVETNTEYVWQVA